MEQFDKYIGIPGVLALLFSCAAVAAIFVGIEFPKEAWALLGGAWGWYFGGRGVRAAASLLNR